MSNSNGKIKSKSSNNMKELALCAVLIALATLLGMVKLLHLPYGGSITLLSMLAATLCGYFCGTAKGIIACLALGLLNFVLGPEIVHPAQVILDYFLAYGALGLSGITRNQKHGLTTGYLIGVSARFLCSFLSGFVFFAAYAPESMNPIIYSFLYNITYIGVEAVITLIIINIPAVKNALYNLKTQL